VPRYLGLDRSADTGSEAGGATSNDVSEGSSGHEAERRMLPEPFRTARELAALTYRLATSWYRIAPGYRAAWLGHVALFDRHPVEVLAVRPDRTPLGRAYERFAVRHLLPHLDAIVVLDAPGEMLFARKPEHPVEVLEEWRRGYAREFPQATRVSTAAPTERSVAEVSAAVWRAVARRRGWDERPDPTP
jgi:hypothetical protein